MSSKTLSSTATPSPIARFAPGIAAAILVSLVSVAGGLVEDRFLGRAILEPIVLAILVGMVVRTATGSVPRAEPGIRFVSKEVLEAAVFLLGATMDVPRLLASGPALAIGIVLLVSVALGAGVLIGRAAGLSPRLAVLVACGNAICGNSAIAAVAPVIGADLGVGLVLGLPLLIGPLGFSQYQYGVLCGLTVYAVPQVLAAAFAVSTLSGQVATAVKLARVLMLGPVVVFFAVRHRDTSSGVKLSLTKFIPWFVLGFILLAALRSLGAIPDAAAAGASVIAKWLTIAAMAALGLTVDIRSVKQVGARVAAAVAGCLLVLLCLSIALIKAL
jgi:uncharacterized integral membrane protein (TIGR00698 family)